MTTAPTSSLAPSDWESFLSSKLERAVQVSYGRARCRVLEAELCSEPQPMMKVRMSDFFAEAPEQVRAAVAAWLRSGKRARKETALLDRWIADTVERLPPTPPRREHLRSRGKAHDLGALVRELRREEFSEQVLPAKRVPLVTWGKRSGRRAQHSLQLGCFVPESSLIRIHPVLDQAAVPSWFVRYVLFHELLHAVYPPAPGPGGRLVHHGPLFQKREARYPDYQRAHRWQDANMGALLKSARSNRPIPRSRAVGFIKQNLLFANLGRAN